MTKLQDFAYLPVFLFESDVILYSDKTYFHNIILSHSFESDVILYSDKTVRSLDEVEIQFESDVILYSDKT